MSEILLKNLKNCIITAESCSIELASDWMKCVPNCNIYNYYGLVEQTGSIFFECNCGFMVTSNYSEVLIRNENFEVVKDGNYGFIQLMSLLPTSYPGHNILTEDIGEIIGENNCRCGRKGKYFKIHGRAKGSELRGCSNL